MQAKTSFLDGDQYANMAGIIAVLLSAALVFSKFPKHDEERKLLMEYHGEDMAAMAAAPPSGTVTPTPSPRSE